MADELLFPRRPRQRSAGPVSTTWWGRAFVRSFEETVVDPAELRRARSLARSGRLGAVMVLPGISSAVVDPGREGSCLAQVRVERLDDRAWTSFAAELSKAAGHLAALESGELPDELVEHADEVGVELLPGPGDFTTACDCAAWVQPCPHALALLYQLARLIDSDPYVLLLLRGRSRQALLEAAVPAPEEITDSAGRAAALIALAEDAPTGHGLADAALAAYDEEASRLV